MDLGAKVTEAWLDFRRALASALVTLPEGADVELTLDPSASGVGEALFGVTVRATGNGAVQAFAVGNPSLPPEHRLGRAAVGELVALGWSPPGVVNGDDRFGLQQPVGDGTRLAGVITRTLRDVYGTPHPAFLVYTVNPDELRETFPPLAAARSQPPGGGPAYDDHIDLSALSLPEQVSTVIGAMMNTPPESLPIDRDGDIGIRSGSAMVFVRVRDNPPLVDVFSPVLTDVTASEQLHVRLAELTHRMPIGRLYCIGDTVWASVPVFGRDFQATHLMLAVQVMTGLADELDDRLHGEFGGKRFFADPTGEGAADDPPSNGGPDDDHHTGMYL
ncbi:T3SS (YopN, CesT) and YbjN peptide-binding chaperone 1 [Luedemannella helvata]